MADMNGRMTLDELIDAVKKHASENYDRDGWDFVVECFGRDELIPLLREAGAATPEDAIAAVGEIAKLHDERRSDVLAASGEYERCGACGQWKLIERSCHCGAIKVEI